VEKIGSAVAQGLSVEAGKMVVKKVLSSLPTRSKEPVIFFGLFCNFREMPSYDSASSVLNEIILIMHPRGQQLSLDKQTFEYEITWDYVEGCEIPYSSWENDVLMNQDEKQESIDWSMVSNCLSGFILWLSPISLGDKKELMISAYRILDEISRKIQSKFNISKINKFIFLILSREENLRVQSRLIKKMEKMKLPGTVDVASISADRMLLTVPLHEMLTAMVFVDSFKLWGLF